MNLICEEGKRRRRNAMRSSVEQVSDFIGIEIMNKLRLLILFPIFITLWEMTLWKWLFVMEEKEDKGEGYSQDNQSHRITKRNNKRLLMYWFVHMTTLNPEEDNPVIPFVLRSLIEFIIHTARSVSFLIHSQFKHSIYRLSKTFIFNNLADD